MPVLQTSLMRPARGRRTLAEVSKPKTGGGNGARHKAALASMAAVSAAATAAAASAAASAASAASAGKKKQSRLAVRQPATGRPLAAKQPVAPVTTRLAHGGDSVPMLSTRLNVFTGISIIAIVVLIAVVIALHAQVGSVETKLMIMLATSS